MGGCLAGGETGDGGRRWGSRSVVWGAGVRGLAEPGWVLGGAGREESQLESSFLRGDAVSKKVGGPQKFHHSHHLSTLLKYFRPHPPSPQSSSPHQLSRLQNSLPLQSPPPVLPAHQSSPALTPSRLLTLFFRTLRPPPLKQLTEARHGQLHTKALLLFTVY